MTKNWLIALVLCLAGVAQAQESDIRVSVGVKAWHTQWDTFGYYPEDAPDEDQVLVQVPSESKLVLVPLLSLRYRDFVGSLSVYPSTNHSGGMRKEFDINLGYYVLPNVALTLGYKKLEQSGGGYRYVLGGPVAGVNATAPLGGNFAMYGTFALSRMKSTGSSNVYFDSDYRLSEVGVAYTVPTSLVSKALTFSIGYRSQVLTSKEAAYSGQDGRDLTQGLTFGVVASF